jgi:hypothetical protein
MVPANYAKRLGAAYLDVHVFFYCSSKMLQNIVALVGLLLVTLICAEANVKTRHNLVELDELWTSFKKAYNKFYDDTREDSYRLRFIIIAKRVAVFHLYRPMTTSARFI